MSGSKRAARVADQIRAEIAEILLRRAKDPRLGFLTVTQVDLTNDLRRAKAFVSVMDEGAKREAILEGLRSASGFIRSELGKRLGLRYVPELVFELDESFGRADRVLRILSDLNKEGE